jgi:hypothetical protein
MLAYATAPDLARGPTQSPCRGVGQARYRGGYRPNNKLLDFLTCDIAGHRAESTVRYLGVEFDETLEIAERIDL